MADSSDDEFGAYDAAEGSRYPVHDCVEFEDADSLRVSSGVRLWRPGGGGGRRHLHWRCRLSCKGPCFEEKQALFHTDTSFSTCFLTNSNPPLSLFQRSMSSPTNFHVLYHDNLARTTSMILQYASLYNR